MFAVFQDGVVPFRQSMGLDFRGYQDWAGARMNELGAQWTRGNTKLGWDAVEPTLGGAFEWNGSDEVLEGATRSGVHFLGGFFEGDGPIEFPGRPRLRNPLDDLPAYQRFIEAAVERYDGDGIDDAPGGVIIKYWQVGNETEGWKRSGRSPSDYVRWFEATAEAARRADSGVRLVLMASTEGNKFDPLHAEAINSLAAKGVRFDAIDIHHWGRADLKESTMSAVPQYQAALAAAGLSGVEFWSCEHGTYLGAPTRGSGQCSPACAADQVCAAPRCVPRCASDATCPQSDPHCDTGTGLCGDPSQSELDQARSLVYRYVVNRALGVKRIMWNNLVGWRCFGTTCGGFFDCLGLIADGYGPNETSAEVGKRRLAFHSYRLLAARTDDPVADQLGKIASSDPGAHLYGYRNRATGETGLVAWADSARSVTVELAAEGAQLTSFVTDAAGTPLRNESLAVSAGQFSVDLDADPVWISPSR